MSARKLYRTKAGVLVALSSRHRALRRGKREWIAFATRVPTGGRHGWLWLRNLRRVGP